MKKLRLRSIFVVISCFVVILGITLAVKQTKKNKEIEVVSSINNYNYILESNQTKIFKKYFKDLKKELNDGMIDEENYAKLVTKLFLIDFYTLSNKITNQDIGGVQFIHSTFQDNFKLKAKDTFYKYLQSNIYGTRNQELPTVKDVEIDYIEQTSFTYQETIDNSAYQVNAKITYKKDLGYDTSKTIILVHEEEKLVIVEIKDNM